MAHVRTKYTDICYHYIREALNEGTIILQYCPMQEIIADILTKPLPKGRFEILCNNTVPMKVVPKQPDELSGSVAGSN